MIKELVARGLVVAGKALLTILPESQPEQCDSGEALEYFTETNSLVMSVAEYQAMSDCILEDIPVDDYDAFGEAEENHSGK